MKTQFVTSPHKANTPEFEKWFDSKMIPYQPPYVSAYSGCWFSGPRMDDFEYGGVWSIGVHSTPFPACCGMNILSSLHFEPKVVVARSKNGTTVQTHTLSEEFLQKWANKVFNKAMNEGSNSGNNFMYIVNPAKIKTHVPLLLGAGFEPVGDPWNNPVHNSTLTLFVKSKPALKKGLGYEETMKMLADYRLKASPAPVVRG